MYDDSRRTRLGWRLHGQCTVLRLVIVVFDSLRELTRDGVHCFQTHLRDMIPHETSKESRCGRLIKTRKKPFLQR